MNRNRYSRTDMVGQRVDHTRLCASLGGFVRFIGSENESVLRFPGTTWDQIRCAVEPLPGRIGATLVGETIDSN